MITELHPFWTSQELRNKINEIIQAMNNVPTCPPPMVYDNPKLSKSSPFLEDEQVNNIIRKSVK